MPSCAITNCSDAVRARGRCNKHYAQLWREENLTQATKIERKRNLRVRGVTEEEYAALLKKQNGGCAICGTPDPGPGNGNRKNLCVDHDHKTNKVRGLLCSACNLILGKANDDEERLLKAATYLRSSREETVLQ